MTITKHHIVNGKSQEGSVYVHKSLEIDLFHLIDFGCSKYISSTNDLIPHDSCHFVKASLTSIFSILQLLSTRKDTSTV